MIRLGGWPRVSANCVRPAHSSSRSRIPATRDRTLGESSSAWASGLPPYISGVSRAAQPGTSARGRAGRSNVENKKPARGFLFNKLLILPYHKK